MYQKERRHPTRLQVIQKHKIGRREEVVIEEKAYPVATVANISPIQRTVLLNIFNNGPATLYEVWDRMHFTHQSQADAPLKKLAKEGYLTRQTEEGEARNGSNRFRYYLTDAGFIEAMNMRLAVIYEQFRDIKFDNADIKQQTSQFDDEIFALAEHAATKHPSVCPLILRKYDVIAEIFAETGEEGECETEYWEDKGLEESLPEPEIYDPFGVFCGRDLYADSILGCFEYLSEIVPARCRHHQTKPVPFEEQQGVANTLMNVVFFQTILEPNAMPFFVEPFIEGLMQDEELAVAAQKGVSLYYEEISGYLASIRHIESLFERNPVLKMNGADIFGGDLAYKMLIASWEE